MKTVTWKGKGKVPEVQNGISNPGRNVRKGQVMETKQEGGKKKTKTDQPTKKNPTRNQNNNNEKIRTSMIKHKDVREKGERKERVPSWARKWKPVK